MHISFYNNTWINSYWLRISRFSRNTILLQSFNFFYITLHYNYIFTLHYYPISIIELLTPKSNTKRRDR